MVTDAVRVPVAVGWNVTLSVQFAPAAKLAPQVLVCEKSPLFVPATAIVVTERAALPSFVSVIVWAALVLPIIWLAKVKLAGFRMAMGAGGAVLIVNTCAEIEPAKACEAEV